MKFRFASALFALALPLAAQAPAAKEVEGVFYKAFWLDKGERDFVGAMALYEEFLNKAPEHKLATEAAKKNFELLKNTGKTKELAAFKTKYAKLLGDAADAPAAERPARGDADARGGEGRGAAGGAGGRMDPAARMAQLEKDLAKAKEEGDEEAIKKAEAAIERAKQMAERGGRGQGGQGGQGRRGGLLGALSSNKKYSEMTDEEKKGLNDAIAQAPTQIDRIREMGQDEMADKMEAGVKSLKTAIDGGKADEIQKAIDTLKESMPRGRGGRGGGGGAGGGGGGNGGGGGGGGGNNGGGGGGGR